MTHLIVVDSLNYCSCSPSSHPFVAQESWFFMRTGTKFEREDETKESLQLSAKTGVSGALLESLIDGEHGILKPGLLPKIDLATPAAAKNLLNSIEQARGLGSGSGIQQTLDKQMQECVPTHADC